LFRNLSIRGVRAIDSSMEIIMYTCDEIEPQKADFALDIYIFVALENNIFNYKFTVTILPSGIFLSILKRIIN
jgi:hypothetical protein